MQTMLAFYARKGKLYMARLTDQTQEILENHPDDLPQSDYWTELEPISLIQAIRNLFRLSEGREPRS
jgi:hypothetical protein